MSERTPAETQAYADKQMDAFFEGVSLAIKVQVVTLPKRVKQGSAIPAMRLQEVLKTADAIFDYAGQFAACERGCGHCCHVSVPITAMEANWMGERLGVTPVKIKKNIRHNLADFGTHTPCPFLSNGECSIYEARPLACRMHMNFDRDNYWCLHENWHKPDAEIPRPSINAIVDTYLDITANERVMADIRDFFPQGKATHAS